MPNSQQLPHTRRVNHSICHAPPSLIPRQCFPPEDTHQVKPPLSPVTTHKVIFLQLP